MRPAIVLFTLIFCGAAALAQSTAEKQLFDLVNREREKAKLSKLEWSDRLAQAALARRSLATARVGGLVAAALLAFVFVRQGSNEQLVEGFRIAAVIGAAISAAAAASALLLIRLPGISVRS